LRPADVVRAERRALPAGQPRRLALESLPAVRRGVVELEDPFRRFDAPELAIADRHRAPRQHDAFFHAAGDLLLVLLALAVAIEDARDGRVSPVDDRVALEETRRLADQDFLHARLL